MGAGADCCPECLVMCALCLEGAGDVKKTRGIVMLGLLRCITKASASWTLVVGTAGNLPAAACGTHPDIKNETTQQCVSHPKIELKISHYSCSIFLIHSHMSHSEKKKRERERGEEGGGVESICHAAPAAAACITLRCPAAS